MFNFARGIFCNSVGIGGSFLQNRLDGSEDDNCDCDQKKVHFAPDVSSIVTLFEGDDLFDSLESSAEASVNFRSELEACLQRLREEASIVLVLTQV